MLNVCKFQEYLGNSRQFIPRNKEFKFVICVISSTKNLVNLKPLASVSMEHVGLTEQLFGQWKMDLNIFFHLPNFILRV